MHIHMEFELKNRVFKDLEDARAKLPCNLTAMADFALDETQDMSLRVDFLHTLAGQQHPSIQFILTTIRDRDAGEISRVAEKLLHRYSPGIPIDSYNNINEAMSELPKHLHKHARDLLSGRCTVKELVDNVQALAASHHPAAIYLIVESGFANSEYRDYSDSHRPQKA